MYGIIHQNERVKQVSGDQESGYQFIFSYAFTLCPHAFLSPVDFFQNKLLKKFFQEYHLSVKQIGFRSGQAF